MPPRADTETTYTVIWSVTNSSNDVTDARVRAILPPYVSWKGAVNPGGEAVSFSNVGGEVVWDLGDVPAGVGYTQSAREVAFQVGVTPSVSQVGSSPDITGAAVFSGRDRFTETVVSRSVPEVTINLTTDPLFSSNQRNVVE